MRMAIGTGAERTHGARAIGKVGFRHANGHPERRHVAGWGKPHRLGQVSARRGLGALPSGRSPSGESLLCQGAFMNWPWIRMEGC